MRIPPTVPLAPPPSPKVCMPLCRGLVISLRERAPELSLSVQPRQLNRHAVGAVVVVVAATAYVAVARLFCC